MRPEGIVNFQNVCPMCACETPHPRYKAGYIYWKCVCTYEWTSETYQDMHAREQALKLETQKQMREA